jgi:predicted RNA-binding Zn ribbon-like protein
MYDFESGDLSLDYANTKDWHGSQKPVERLASYADLIEWGVQAGLVDAELARQLLEAAEEHPRATFETYEQAIALREAIYHIFSSLYAVESIPADDLGLLNSFARQAMTHLQLAPRHGGFEWEWLPEMDGINRILWPVARAAAELLASDRLSRVRECEDDRGCGYLFIDQTRNHSRRWCSMDSCGNRAKAHRHYSRLQAG